MATSVSGSPIYRCEEGRNEAGVMILPPGALVGAVTGYLMRTDRWVGVSRTEFRLALDPAADRLGVSIRMRVGGF